MSWSPIPEDRSTTVGDALQPVLVDVIGLALVGKQAHWTVTGREFTQVHEQLDTLVDAWRGWSDRLAERMVALGVVPDGQPASVAEADVPKLALGWQDTHDALASMADGVAAVAARVRGTVEEIGDVDPVTEGVLLEILEGLEEQHWMLRAQLS